MTCFAKFVKKGPLTKEGGDLDGGAMTTINATTVKQERTEQYAATFIARWNLAWLWLTEAEVDAERKVKIVVKKKEKGMHQAECCVLGNDGGCMRCAKGTEKHE